MFEVKTVKGEPRTIYGREFVPLVRVLSYFRGDDEKAPEKFGGAGFVIMRPVAVLESGPQGTRRIRILDMTNIALIAVLLAGLLLSLLIGGVVRSTSRRR